jgi:hypothetical protein
MSDYEERRTKSHGRDAGAPVQPSTPGRGTLVEQSPAPVVQQRASGQASEATVHDAASRGVATPASPLPFANSIQRAFGRHDISAVQAHTGSDAAASAHAMGADAYATGNHVVLGRGGDLHTVAHEAAHVVQQRAGVHLKGGVGEVGDVHERHADAVADLVVQGRSAEGMLDQYTAGGDRGATAGGQPVQRAMREARVDAETDALYAQKAEAFELGMSPILAADPEANAGVDRMMEAVQKIVDAYASHTGKAKEATYAQELGWAGGDKYYGALEMTGTAIKKIFDDKSQPLRSKLKLVYNAVRNNNLGKWLEIAAQELQNAADGKAPADILVHRTEQNVRTPDGQFNPAAAYTNDQVTPGFAAASGLDGVLTGGHLAAATNKLAYGKYNYGDGRDHVISGADTFSPLIAPSAELTKANRDRRPGQNAGIDIADLSTLAVGDVPDLTDDEIRQIYKIKGQPAPDATETAAYKSKGAEKIPWEQGGSYFDVIANSDVDTKAAEIRGRLEAGVSGSTDLMLHTAQELGLGDATTMSQLRLAMVGWMLQNRDHSFYEVMQAATSYGLPFVTDPAHRGAEYEAPANFHPMNPAKLRNILPEKQFPGYFAGGASRSAVELALPEPDKPADAHRAGFVAAGIPQAISDVLDERALADLSILEREVAATPFGPAADARAIQLNHQHVRRIQRSAPYLSLVHAHPTHAAGMVMSLIRHAHGDDALNDTESRLEASQSELPPVGTDGPGRRQVLEDAGVPAGALAGAPEHLIPELLQLLAFVQQAAYDTTGAPTAAATNNAETRKLKETAPYKNAVLALGPLKTDLILSSLCRHRHPGFESTVYALPSARAEALVTAGIPENVVSLTRDDGFITDLTNLVASIDGVVVLPPANHLAGLQALAGLYPTLAGFLTPPKFNLVVASVARKRGVAFAQGSDEEVLADLGEILQPNATRIDASQEAAFDTAATQRHFAGNDGDYRAATGGARTTLDTNLLKYPDIDGDQYEDLTDAELWGINEYTKFGGMGQWQAAIASMNPKDKKMFGLGKLNLKIKAAISGLNKIKPYTGQVYNGQKGPAVDRSNPVAVQQWIDANYPLGKVEAQPNFLSSAKSAAASFISKAGYDIACIISNVKTGRDIQPISTNDGEEEVLFPPGAKLLVTKVENKLSDPDPNNRKLWVHYSEV